MAKPSRFKKIGPNEWAPVVNPKTGEIMHVRYASNLGGGVCRVDDRGKCRISDDYADKGFRFLADYYQEDPDSELQERGLEVYLDYQAAIEREAAQRKEQNGNHRATFVPVPKEWLPSAVVALQDNQSAGTHKAPSRSKAKAAAKPKAKGATL